MKQDEFIIIEEFCSFHEVEVSLLQELEEMGIIELINIEENLCISCETVYKVERLIRLQRSFELRNQDLDLIDTLLKRIDQLEKEIKMLK